MGPALDLWLRMISTPMGFPDLVCGTQRHNAAWYRFNVQKFLFLMLRRNPRIFAGIGRQEFRILSCPKAGYVEVPERPDFIGTVDFNT